VCYVATWEVVYFKLIPGPIEHHLDKYAEHIVAKERAAGKSQQEIDARLAELNEFRKQYRNPLVNSAFTFLEPLPVGLIMTLVSAGILRRRKRDSMDRAA